MVASFNRLKLLGLVLAAAFLASFAAEARAPEIYLQESGLFSRAWEYAADGYDVVAYFDLDADAAPVAGNDAFVTDYKGVKWRFASQENLDAFEADPSRYAPAYGGYCAWATARGYLAKGDPAAWSVHNGTLYLNFNNRIRRDWLSDVDNEISRGDANWPDVLDTE